MIDRTDAVLAAIDGALMDPELPDGMRWSPEPETAEDPQAMPYDGELVPTPPQRYERHSDAEGTGQGVSRPLPPGGSMLLAQLRAEHVRLRQERARLIADGIPPEALTPPLDPDAWRPVGTLTPESTTALGDSIREAMRAALHRRAERIQADARAAPPRVSVHYNPRVAAPVPADMPVPVDGLLVVEEHGGGLITVRHPTNEEVSQVITDAWQAVVETFTPLVESMRDAFRGFTDALCRAGVAPTGPPTTPEARRSLGLPPLSPADVRTAALEARRHRNTGPAPLGPERSPRPRTHR